MPRSLVAVLALIACGFGSEAFAQSPDGAPADTGAAGAAPTLILPSTLTNPITSGLDSEGHGSASAPGGNETPDATPQAPYSVEGEETLDPDTN
jgi:hypothetical protein